MMVLRVIFVALVALAVLNGLLVHDAWRDWRVAQRSQINGAILLLAFTRLRARVSRLVVDLAIMWLIVPRTFQDRAIDAATASVLFMAIVGLRGFDVLGDAWDRYQVMHTIRRRGRFLNS